MNDGCFDVLWRDQQHAGFPSWEVYHTSCGCRVPGGKQHLNSVLGDTHYFLHVRII